MCRWFAYISPTEPCLLEDVLVTPKHSLAKQVSEHYLPKLLPHDHTPTEEDDMKARNVVFNVDGLGIAWYTSANADFEREHGESSDGLQKEGLRPALFKCIQPPMHELNFRSICANTETRVLLAHIRASSGTPIATVNNHPFVFGRHAFMHNGVVSDFTTIRRAMTAKMSNAAFAGVHGGTDSEHLAALYMTHLTADSRSENPFEETYTLREMSDAMQYAVAVTLKLQRDMIPDSERKANSLNLCVTDGEKIVAYRFRNHAMSQPPSLYYSAKAGVTLNRKYPDHPDGEAVAKDNERKKREDSHGLHLIIASEPSTYKVADWKLIGRNQRMMADVDGTFVVEDIGFDAEWDAKN